MSGQRFRLQERYLTRTPWQYLPPFDGTGLLHSLLDSWTPPPHVREQEPNGPHLPQRPSTWKYTNQKHIAEGITTKTYLNHIPVKVYVNISPCVTLTFTFWTCLSVQTPRSQDCPSPQWVPSAHGKCLVIHTRWPLDFPVHHRRPHGGCMKGQGLEPSPKASSH